MLSEATVPNSNRYQAGVALPNANEISDVSASGSTMTLRYRPAVWVSFGFGGPFGGDFTNPYPDLPTALGGIADDGIIICKSGTTSSVPPSSRIMRYKSYGGPTTFAP